MQKISTWKEQPLSPDLVFETHRTVTDQTLDNPNAAGRLRRPWPPFPPPFRDGSEYELECLIAEKIGVSSYLQGNEFTYKLSK